MTHSKFSFFLFICMFITVGAFIAGLEAQDTEENSALVKEFVKKAQEHVEQNQIEEAIELYQRIVIAAPEDVDSLGQLAILYARTKQHEKAAQTYSQLLKTDPENMKYQNKLIKSLQDAGKVTEALEIAQTYVETYPEVGVYYARLAELYEAEGNETAAITNYEKATAFGQGDINIFLLLAEHYFANTDIVAAEKALKNAMPFTTSERERERIERQLTYLYLYQGSLEEMCQKAEAEGTLTFQMQDQRARHFYNTGELEQAAFHFKKAFKMTNISSRRNGIANTLIDIYLKQNRTDLALDFYETEISKQSRSKFSARYTSPGIMFRFVGDDARQILIDAYEKQGKISELKTLIESKLEKDLDNLAILELLAEIYLYTKNYQKAAETYHTLSLNKAESNYQRRYIAVYQAAAAFLKCGEPDMAKKILNGAASELAASNLLEEDESLLVVLATICFKNEMFDLSLKYAKNAIYGEQRGRRDPNKALYEILAKSYLSIKRYEKAYETYQEIADYGNWSYDRESAENWMNEAAKAGNLYEKWISEQLKQVEDNPNDAKRILKLAQSYEAIAKVKEAVDQYERLIELEPENLLWYKKLGDLYQNLPQEKREIDTVPEGLIPEQLVKSIAAYEKAIELDTDLYYLYDLLAQTYIKAAQTSQADATYRRALDAPLTQDEHDAVFRAITGLYVEEGQENKLIAILEEFKSKVDQSAALHEHLGDLYKKVGDAEKSEFAHAKWMEIKQKALNSARNAHTYRDFADKLLDKGLYPETALNFAKRALFKYTSSHYLYPATLGRACIANGFYDEALKYYKHALNLAFDDSYLDMFWEKIAAASKNANDKERYIQMLGALISSIPLAYPNKRANIYSIIVGIFDTNDLSDIYSIIADSNDENSMSENAEKFLLNNGFIPETYWVTLGPFKNIDSRGVLYAYIPEEITQIDATGKYYGRDQLISWEKSNDTNLDGLYDFGNIDGINNGSAAYVWTVIISPDERDIVMRFDSDDQGLIWLNGKKVFEHFRTSGVEIDRYTIPVTLKKGENSLLVKVGNAWQAWNFYLRLTDADGKPFGDLKFKNADELLNTTPPKSTFHLNVNLGMAEYYSKNNMPDKAIEQMRQTGMIHEKKWSVLGAFDNTAGIGYNTEYIPEDTTQIDRTAKYDGIDGQISWKKWTDDAFDGFIDLGRNINWRVSYAWTTVTSPDEREVQLRFGSDDQAKVWFNGKEVFAYSQFRWAVVDSDIIPVTLKAGKNTILVKVCNEERTWGFYLRVTDAAGKPYDDLNFSDMQDN